MPNLAILATHPIQYYSPWFAHLARHMNLHVYYAFRQTPEGQAAAGFKTAFDWDLDLLEGYESTFLDNVSKQPGVGSFCGCDTPEIASRLRAGSYDALLMFGWNKLSFIQAWLAALRIGIPVLIRLDSQLGSSRSSLKRALKRPIYSMVLPTAAHYLSPGERSDTYLRHYGVPHRRIHRVPHMIDVDRFAAGAQAAHRSGAAADLRQRHGASPNSTVFLTVGKLIAKKRPMLALQAFSRLPQDSGAILWMIGDGPMESEIDARIKAEGLNVKRLGFVNQTELPAHYASADCLLLPSDANETWGLVVNEAQACGLPSIVSEEAGCAPELIEDGITGWTLRTSDPDELANLMQRMIEKRGDPNWSSIESRSQSSSYNEGTHLLTQIIHRIITRRSGPDCASQDRQEAR
ncbi:glycosyltransferase family 4 protein [Thalassovita mediterranea]|nr:glycosyltransferase family 4 protein [Thalassovita mediterranea]